MTSPPKLNIHIFMIIILCISFIPNSEVNALSQQWEEVPSSNEGRQWLDTSSIRKLSNGNIEVLSRFTPTFKNEIDRPR